MLTTTQGVIADELNAHESVTWFTSSYLVAMSSIVPVTGRISYIMSPRTLIFISTVVIALGTLVTGLAKSLPMFLVGRVIAGVGAGGIASVAIILVVQLFSARRRGLTVGLLNSAFTFGVAAGAILSGALEPVIGWRALFWLQSPIAVLSGVGILLCVPAGLSADDFAPENNKTAWQKAMDVDYIGAILLVLSIVSLLFGLSTPDISWTPIIASALIFPLFLYQEIYRHPDPIIPVSILGSRSALCCCMAALGFMMARWAVLFYTPIFATAVRGWGPAKAGSILIPTNAGFALGGIISGVAHIRRAGTWYISCLVIFAIFPLTLTALTLVSTANSPTWTILLCTFTNGLCAGAAINYTLHHALYLVEPEAQFIITSLLTTFRGFAGTFGSAIGGGVFIRVLKRSLQQCFADAGLSGHEDLIRRLLGSPRAVQDLVGTEKGIAIDAYTKAIQSLFWAGVVLSGTMLIVQSGTRNKIQTRRDMNTERLET
jgi:predicted MFS family arabinose efflux permease